MAPVLLTLAALGIVYMARSRSCRRTLKRLVAYVGLDRGCGVHSPRVLRLQRLRAVSGGVLEMVNHALTTGAIFFLKSE